MNRRNFLKGMIAVGMAPAIVKADNLMKLYVPPEKKVVISEDFYIKQAHPGIMQLEIVDISRGYRPPTIITVSPSHDFKVGNTITIGGGGLNIRTGIIRKITHDYHWVDMRQQYTRRDIKVDPLTIERWG